MSLWTKIFGEPSDWRLVKEIQAGYVSYKFDPLKPETKINERDQEMTYYLYEDQDGNRKFDVVDSQEGDIDVNSVAAKKTWTFRSEDYRYTIRPWMDGRHNPEIPSYEQVPVDDFKVALKGKK